MSSQRSHLPQFDEGCVTLPIFISLSPELVPNFLDQSYAPDQSALQEIAK